MFRKKSVYSLPTRLQCQIMDPERKLFFIFIFFSRHLVVDTFYFQFRLIQTRPVWRDKSRDFVKAEIGETHLVQQLQRKSFKEMVKIYMIRDSGLFLFSLLREKRTKKQNKEIDKTFEAHGLAI